MSVLHLMFLAGLSFVTFADESMNALTQALAVNEGVGADWFRDVSLQKSAKGATLKYIRERGEGGDEKCEALYRSDKTLQSLKCTVDYVSHSMGPENKRYLIDATRIYDSSGQLIQVKGSVSVTRVSDQKVVESRKIKLLKDDVFEGLTKPLLRWER